MTQSLCHNRYEFYKFKSLNYAHHLIELNQSHHWPIYIDNENCIIDSTIFAIGIVQNESIIFAKHPFQLQSISRQVILDRYSSHSVTHQQLFCDDLKNADAVIGCNAIKGVFILGKKDVNIEKFINENVSIF